MRMIGRLARLALASSMAMSATSALAAEKITLVWGAWYRSIPVEELRHLATTGEAVGLLGNLLGLMRQDPVGVQQLLNQEISIELYSADKLLNSSIGEALLDKLAMVVTTPSQREGRKALRCAVIMSLADDEILTPLEMIEKYPVNIRINVGELVKLQTTFGSTQGFLGAHGVDSSDPE